jgi:RNase H-fold protein (predicted Holliday junction resolvase)
MNHQTNHFRILAIAPTTRGFGFAVLDEKDALADWGGKPVKAGNKNAQSLKKAKELIDHNRPNVLVLQDTAAKDSGRAPRIQKLTQQIVKLAKVHKVKVVLLSKEKIQKAFFADGKGTKQALAEVLAQKFPEELGSMVPPKRKPWMTEHPRMDVFDAVALAVVFQFAKSKTKTN